MTRKRGRPTPDEVRCPQCGVVAWRRVGERVDVERAGGERRLVHAFEQGDGHWEWTCAGCGYAVRATSVLDNALARVQPVRVPAIIGGLFGAGAGAAAGAEGSGAAASAGAAAGGLPRQLQAGLAAAAGVAAVAVIAVAAMFLGRPAGSPPSPTSPAAAASAAATPGATVTELAALADAGPDMAGRRLELDRAEVARVTGDTTFWLGTAGSEAFVVIDEEQQPEGDVTVRTGQQVRVTGMVHEGPPDGVELSDEDRTALEGVPVYVVADEVEIVEE